MQVELYVTWDFKSKEVLWWNVTEFKYYNYF